MNPNIISIRTRLARLEDRLDEVVEQLEFATEYRTRDPSGSLTKSRIVLEKLVLQLWTFEMDSPPKRPELGAMLNNNQFTRKIPRRIVSLMNSIRDMANLGAHGEQVETRDADRALSDLCEVLNWYLDSRLNELGNETEKEGDTDAGNMSAVKAKARRISILAAILSAVLIAILIVWQGQHGEEDVSTEASVQTISTLDSDANTTAPADPTIVNPDELIMGAFESFLLAEHDNALEALSSLIEHPSTSDADLRRSLGLKSQVLVDAGRLGEATSVITDLLEMSPPLIMLDLSHDNEVLRRVYNNVRRQQLATRRAPTTIEAVCVQRAQIVSKNTIPTDVKRLEKGLPEMLTTHLSNLGIITVERLHIHLFGDELGLGSPVSHLHRLDIDSPWLLWDESNLPANFIRCTHLLTSRIVLSGLEDSTDENVGQSGKMLLTLEVYGHGTGQLEHVSRGSGELGEFSSIIYDTTKDIVEQLKPFCSPR